MWPCAKCLAEATTSNILEILCVSQKENIDVMKKPLVMIAVTKLDQKKKLKYTLYRNGIHFIGTGCKVSWHAVQDASW